MLHQQYFVAYHILKYVYFNSSISVLLTLPGYRPCCLTIVAYINLCITSNDFADFYFIQYFIFVALLNFQFSHNIADLQHPGYKCGTEVH